MLIVLGLCCCRLVSSCGERGYSLVATRGLLTAVASLVEEDRLYRAPRLYSTGLIVVAHGLSCSTACGILPDKGSHLCLLHWHVNALPLSYQESLRFAILSEIWTCEYIKWSISLSIKFHLTLLNNRKIILWPR